MACSRFWMVSRKCQPEQWQWMRNVGANLKSKRVIQSREVVADWI